MKTKAVRIPKAAKPDLVGAEIESLMVRFDVPLDSDLGQTINTAFTNEMPFFGRLGVWTYVSNGNNHVVSEFVSIENVEDTLQTVHAQIRITGAGPKKAAAPASLRTDRKLVEILVESESEHVYDVNVRFTFDFDENTTDPSLSGHFFPLPAKIPTRGRDDAPITEIRGIRGAKLKPTAVSTGASDYLYQFILDRPDNESISLSVLLDLEGALDSAISESCRTGISVAESLGLLQRGRD